MTARSPTSTVRGAPGVAAAFTATSGPMPLGSPIVSAMRILEGYSGKASSVSTRELSQTTTRSFSFSAPSASGHHKSR